MFDGWTRTSARAGCRVASPCPPLSAPGWSWYGAGESWVRATLRSSVAWGMWRSSARNPGAGAVPGADLPRRVPSSPMRSAPKQSSGDGAPGSCASDGGRRLGVPFRWAGDRRPGPDPWLGLPVVRRFGATASGLTTSQFVPDALVLVKRRARERLLVVGERGVRLGWPAGRRSVLASSGDAVHRGGWARPSLRPPRPPVGLNR